MTKDEQQQNLKLNSQNTFFSVLFWQEILFYKKKLILYQIRIYFD